MNKPWFQIHSRSKNRVHIYSIILKKCEELAEDQGKYCDLRTLSLRCMMFAKFKSHTIVIRKSFRVHQIILDCITPLFQSHTRSENKRDSSKDKTIVIRTYLLTPSNHFLLHYALVSVTLSSQKV